MNCGIRRVPRKCAVAPRRGGVTPPAPVPAIQSLRIETDELVAAADLGDRSGIQFLPPSRSVFENQVHVAMRRVPREFPRAFAERKLLALVVTATQALDEGAREVFALLVHYAPEKLAGLLTHVGARRCTRLDGARDDDVAILGFRYS